jgi:hypothetical protein
MESSGGFLRRTAMNDGALVFAAHLHIFLDNEKNGI